MEEEKADHITSHVKDTGCLLDLDWLSTPGDIDDFIYYHENNKKTTSQK